MRTWPTKPQRQIRFVVIDDCRARVRSVAPPTRALPACGRSRRLAHSLRTCARKGNSCMLPWGFRPESQSEAVHIDPQSKHWLHKRGGFSPKSAGQVHPTFTSAMRIESNLFAFRVGTMIATSSENVSEGVRQRQRMDG